LITEGIAFVIVNGIIVTKEGMLTGEKPGKAIRFSGKIRELFLEVIKWLKI